MNPNTLSLIRAVPALGALLLAFPAWATFNDNGNGTVTDDQTGLIWDKCSWGQTWTGAPPTYTNTCSGSSDLPTWAGALAVAVTANTNNHRGYNDWRLPSKNELESLVDITKTAPAIDITVFPNQPSSVFWTSTTLPLNTGYAFRLFLGKGDVDQDLKTNQDYVRLVRSEQSFADFDLLSTPVIRTGELFVSLSGQTYNSTPQPPEGPAGTFSYTARFCNKQTSSNTLVGLFSRTRVLTNGNSLINRTRDAPSAPLGGVGSELDFPFTGDYSDGLLAPGECVNVLYVIGLQQRSKFSFNVDVFGWPD